MFTVEFLDDLITYMSFDIGAAKADITPKMRGMSMLGYGNPHNIVKGVEMPIYARAFYFQDTEGVRLLLINFEICFITDVLRRRVIEEVQHYENIPESHIILSAQHTHSAPSGYTEYALYNMPTPGFVPQVLDAYVKGAVEAYKKAKENLRSANLEYKESEFSPDDPVSFNRSLIAFMQNPEAQKGIFGTEKSSAVDKVMKALLIKQDQAYLSAINWFPVHTTSLPNTNTLVSADNKGYASHFIEEELGGVAIFAQGDAGDVSPNWIWDTQKKVMRGHHADSFENARFNGRLQANKLKDIIKDDGEGRILSSKIDSIICYEDMSCITPDEEFLPAGIEGARTTPACHGVAFAEGTLEGPGVPKFLSFFLKVAATIVKVIDLIRSFNASTQERKAIWNYYNNQEPKSIFVEAGKKKVFGISNLGQLDPIKVVDPLVGTLAKFYKQGSMREHTWTQQILPIQLTQIGELLIVSLPAEVTTVAGYRIKKQMEEMFKDTEIKKIISSPYSNGFCAYVVTPEEYEMQCYEAGHCVFGKWTLPAFQTVLKKLATEFLKERNERDLSWSKTTPRFSEKEIANRSFDM